MFIIVALFAVTILNLLCMVTELRVSKWKSQLTESHYTYVHDDRPVELPLAIRQAALLVESNQFYAL
ncbi:hypothetical protein BS17DRAFT_791131, partial [Gyrodon lividus]